MLKILLATTLLATPALAQMQHTPGMQTGGSTNGSTSLEDAMNGGAMGGMAGGGMSGMADGGMMSGMDGMPGMEKMMEGMMMMMEGMQGGASAGVGGSPLSEPGQSAFVAIAEVVATLEADPNTDWSKVNIDILRQHLQDMDRVTIDSIAVAEEVEGGMRFTVTGSDIVAPSIERMVLGHASIMDGVDGWAYNGEIVANGAEMTVLVPEADLAKLKGIGFYGLLAAGPHHQPHHWAMANGLGMGMAN